MSDAQRTTEQHLYTCIPPGSDGAGGKCLCKLAPAGLIGNLLGSVIAGYRDKDNARCCTALCDIVEYVSNLRAQAGVK